MGGEAKRKKKKRKEERWSEMEHVLKLSSFILVSKDKLITFDLCGNVHTYKQTSVSMTKTPIFLEFCSVSQG